MVRFFALCLLLSLITFTQSSFAQVIRTSTYPGEITVNSPQFQRPLQNCQSLNLQTFFYHSFPLRVEITGTYSILSEQNNFDGYLFIYDETFDPDNNPLQGCIAGNDDNQGDIRSSLIENVTLVADVDYVVVTTGFNTNDIGAFENTIQGPGRAGFAGGTLLFNGSTNGARMFTRPIADCSSVVPGSAANNTRYTAQVFSVSSTADYIIDSTQDFDGFIFVYDERFNPIDPLTGCIVGDDDGAGGVGTSRIDAVRLVAGRTYYLVTTGFVNDSIGNFDNAVTGPGVVFLQPGIFTLASLTGGWFDPALNGSGFNIVAADVGVIFTFYGYINGEQRWLLTNVVQDDVRIGNTIIADLRIGDGGQLNDPGAADVVPFGTLFFLLIDCTTAIALIDGAGQFNNTDQFFNLTRLVQGTGRDCLL